MTGPDLNAVPSRRPGVRWLAFLPLIVFVALAGLFLLRLGAGDPSTIPSALIGKPAPDFDLPPVTGLARDGVPVPGLSSADLTGDRPTIVNVWASWCAPCREEHPFLLELAKDPSIRLVGLNYKDKAENARRFLGALGNPFAAIGKDANGRVGIDWGVYGVPETFVVDRQGIVRLKHVGPLTEEGVKKVLAAARAAN
jgi:cytochrome c biogenesis protein CcmG/thiol:disulfide interchange protein DsbE